MSVKPRAILGKKQLKKERPKKDKKKIIILFSRSKLDNQLLRLIIINTRRPAGIQCISRTVCTSYLSNLLAYSLDARVYVGEEQASFASNFAEQLWRATLPNNFCSACRLPAVRKVRTPRLTHYRIECGAYSATKR